MAEGSGEVTVGVCNSLAMIDCASAAASSSSLSGVGSGSAAAGGLSCSFPAGLRRSSDLATGSAGAPLGGVLARGGLSLTDGAFSGVTSDAGTIGASAGGTGATAGGVSGTLGVSKIGAVSVTGVEASGDDLGVPGGVGGTAGVSVFCGIIGASTPTGTSAATLSVAAVVVVSTVAGTDADSTVTGVGVSPPVDGTTEAGTSPRTEVDSSSDALTGATASTVAGTSV